MENAWELALTAITRAAAKQNAPEQGDYVKDDLLHCGKCNTPKQCVICLHGQEVKVSCMCDCKKAMVTAENKAEQERLEAERRAEYRSQCFALPKWASATFDGDDMANPNINQRLRNYVHNFETFKKASKGLLLYGGVGTGKSFGAACVANAILEQGYKVIMTNFTNIANGASETFNKKTYFENIVDCDLLILDDLAAERKTDYMNEIVYEIINSRYVDGRPLIVTTNLTSEQIKHPADEAMQRVMSRLLEMTIPLEVAGADRRKGILKDDYNELKGLLGM